MLMVQSLPWAIALMLFGMLCLGSWTAAWNAVERRGRLPSHTFIDYSLAYLAVAVIASFIGGQLGPPVVDGRPNFLQQLPQLPEHWPLVVFAAGGGACLALGDIAMQYAVAFLGLSVGPPVLNALTIIIGVVLSFLLDHGLNKPWLVFPGMACAAIAIFMGAAAHLMHTKQQKCRSADDSQQGAMPEADSTSGGQLAAPPAPCEHATCHGDAHEPTYHSKLQEEEQPCHEAVHHPAHHMVHELEQTAVKPDVCIVLDGGQVELLQQRSVVLADSSLWLGLFIALAGGAVYSLFLPAFQIAANDVFSMLPPGTPPLSIYTANFYFSLAFTILSILINVIFLYRPPLGTARSSISNWANDHSGRGLSLVSGVLAAIGDGAQFMGGQAVGYAAAMLVMAYPVVGVLWGVLRFREFSTPTMLARLLLWGQVLFYAAAVGLLAGSATIRTSDTR